MKESDALRKICPIFGIEPPRSELGYTPMTVVPRNCYGERCEWWCGDTDDGECVVKVIAGMWREHV